MKKMLCCFLMLLMLGCGRENVSETENVKTNAEISKTEKAEEIKEEIKNFEIKNISTNSDGMPRIEIEFTDDLAQNENIDAYVKVSGDVKYTVLRDKNKIIINGDFKIGSNYSVEILKGLKGKNGKQIEENIVKTAVFKEIEPKLVFSNDGIILPAGNKKIAFKSVNVKKVNLKIKKVYENNTTHFLQEFIFKGNGNIFDYGVEGRFNEVGDVVFEKTYDLNAEKNIWKQTEVELGDFVDYKGLFIVELTFDEKGIDYTFPENTDSWQKYNLIRNNGRIGKAVLLSDMGIIAEKERDKVTVTVMDIIKNKPLKNADVTLITYNNQVLQKGKTNDKGEFVFDKLDNMMYVLAESGEENQF